MANKYHKNKKLCNERMIQDNRFMLTE